MIKKRLAICVLVAAAISSYGQTRSKRVKQPREVVEAYRVCAEFNRLLAEDLNFDRAFEATFTKDPARRRVIAIDESEIRTVDLTHLDTHTLLRIYKDRTQLFILMLPLIFADTEEKAELFPPPIEAIIERDLPNEPQELQSFAAQLERDVAAFRAHVDKLVATKPSVAEKYREYKNYLLRPAVPPNRIVKPMTAYSKGRVLRLDEKYYQIEDCAVIREGRQMRLVDYTFLRMRF